MKKIKTSILGFLVCVFVLSVGFIHAQAAETFPSETNPFGSNYYIGSTDQKNPFFETVLPAIAANIKENNKHTISPYYDKLPLANNPENFQGLGSATYANINGKTVTAEAFYRVKGDSLHDPNAGMGILIYQCIQYKLAHPEEDVAISFTTYRTSPTAAVCVIPQSKYYGYMRSLYTVNYDEHGFVRISYMLSEAARMGIKVLIVNQLNSYSVKQYNPSTDSLKERSVLSYVTYFNKALATDCYNKYAPGKKVSDFMTFKKVGWTVTNQTANMQHVKSCTVSHYLATDGTEHRHGVFFTTANLDENDYTGANGNTWSQTGVIISDHEPIYRVTLNYTKLMYKYSYKEGIQEFRKIVTDRNEKQTALILSGKEKEIPADEQIVYLGTDKDPVFQLYYTPIGGGVDTWDTLYNPICAHVDKLTESEDYIEFMWNEYGFEENYMGKAIGEKLEKAFCENKNVKNKLSVKVSDLDIGEIEKLKLGLDIGYRSISSGKNMHAKDFLMSYKEKGVRHNVSILTSCNYIMLGFHYRTNSILVIDETEKTGGDFYEIMADKYSHGMFSKKLDLSPKNLMMQVGQTYTPDLRYEGKAALSWSTSKKSVAKVSNGVITAVKAGSATITVSDGSNKSTVKVTVVDCTGCTVATGLTVSGDEQHILSKSHKAAPLTFEASFALSKDVLTGTTVLLGSDGTLNPAPVYSVNKNGQPQVTIRNAAEGSVQSTYVFDKVDVATGKKVHIAIVSDYAKQSLHCYVNGALKQTVTGVSMKSSPAENQRQIIGGDYINSEAVYFKGTLYSAALWSDIRTAAEISEDYSKGITTDDKNLLAAYNLSKCRECLKKDLSANGNNIESIKLRLSAENVSPVGDYEYSFAVIGSTPSSTVAAQKISSWILENRLRHKIEYVLSLDDVTDASTSAQWKNANGFFSAFNGKIPYAVARGNSDTRDAFNKNFGNGAYEKSVDGTMAKGDLTNSYRYFSIQGTDYLILNLDFGADSNALAWAEKTIKAHPGHKVIIITHAYLSHNGTVMTAKDICSPTNYKGYTNALNGEDMWNKCFSKYENVLMVLSSNDPWQHIVCRQDTGARGNAVTQMLVDSQCMEGDNGSAGMVAMLCFSNVGKTLTVRYYSVENECYGSEQSQFNLCLEHNWTAATCTKAKICTVCKETSGKALGHKWAAATCTKAKTCTVCKETSSKALGHKWADATCTKAKTCTVCKETSGKALGHSYTNSCDTSCNRSGCSVTRTITHSWADATCTKAKTCTVCKATSGKALGHSYKNVTTKATLAKNGKVENKCSLCNLVKSTTTVYYPKTISISKTSYTYNGKVQKPSVTVKDSKGNVLKADTDYTVSYEDGRKLPGKYTVKITFKGKYEGVKRLYFTISPKVVSGIEASQTITTITLKWSKVTGADGYRVYRYDSKTKKYVKLKDVTSTTLKISDLKAGTKYKYRVRAFTKDEDTIYGAYSDVFETATKCKTPSVKKLTSTKGKVTVNWSDVSGESGYQVYYSTKKDSGFKKVDSYKANVVKGSKSKLKSGEKYYFKVRAYIKTDSGTVYSSWSSVKSIKVK